MASQGTDADAIEMTTASLALTHLGDLQDPITIDNNEGRPDKQEEDFNDFGGSEVEDYWAFDDLEEPEKSAVDKKLELKGNSKGFLSLVDTGGGDGGSMTIQPEENMMDTTEGEEESQFHTFRLLPPELRIKIWEITCTEPQVIGVKISWQEPTRFDGGRRGIPRSFVDLFAQVPDPRANCVTATTYHSQLLTVNRESREVALKLYSRLTKVFPGQWPVMANLDVDYLWPMNPAKDPWELNQQLGRLKECCPSERRIKTVMKASVWGWMKDILEQTPYLEWRTDFLLKAMPHISNSSEILVLNGDMVMPDNRAITVRMPTGISPSDLKIQELEMVSLLDLPSFALKTGRRDPEAESFKCPTMKLQERYQSTGS